MVEILTAGACLLRLVSGGFAIVQPDSQLSINAVEGFPLEEFSSEVLCLASLVSDRLLTFGMIQAVRSQITEAQKIAGGSGSEQDVAEARIELEVTSPALPSVTESILIHATGTRKPASGLEIIADRLNPEYLRRIGILKMSRKVPDVMT